MRICCPTFWSQDSGIDYGAGELRIGDILPSVGESTFAWFESREPVSVGETVRVMWCPPVADLNGWDEQPSEIAQSYLLEVKVVGAAPVTGIVHAAHYGQCRYELQVLSCERLLSVLRKFQEDSKSDHVPVLPDNLRAWEELSWCGSAVIQEFTYLTANTAFEASMQLILKVSSEEIVVLFSWHADPGGVYCQLGRTSLAAYERLIIARALGEAQPLYDSQPAYLASGPSA
ncbi:hypothetical protein ACOI9X_22580 [Pseudomonas sp. P2757]|uniref:hypothetical protein n=1 Tax=unclassified Pseudomonas TaxID=196821 RepID=UPI003B5B4B69